MDEDWPEDLPEDLPDEAALDGSALVLLGLEDDPDAESEDPDESDEVVDFDSLESEEDVEDSLAFERLSVR